jgi:uncharacterized protein with von Willebrand factor type A (vWA) domain
MLGVDGLNLAIAILDSGLVESAMNEVLDKSQLVIAAENNNMKQSLKTQLSKWTSNTKERLTKVAETERFQSELALYQETIRLNEAEFIEKCPEIIKQLEWHSSFYVEAKRIYDKNRNELNPVFPHYFCDLWYKSLSNAIKEAQLLEIEADKELILKDLYQRIETLKQMDNVTKIGNEEQVGQLWDMAGSKLTKHAIKQLHTYAQFLATHSELKKVAAQLGRMASYADDPELRGSAKVPKMVEEISDEANDDIVGVHDSDDLNKLLPNEIMFLAYPELEVIFYKHLVDKRLMNYKTKGKARSLRNITTAASSKSEQVQGKGPFVVCVDASGSMAGFPENCAKAMAYALMQIALAEKRDCYVLLFSTEQITYELTKQDGLREAADFLSYQFHGGTDFEPVIESSIELMENERYRNADLVVISDFIAPKASSVLENKVQELKVKHNRFHAVSLSKYGNPELLNIFDEQWHYHPSLLGRLASKLTLS